MKLGNTQFNQVEERLGYRLSESDKIVWEKYHNNNANLEGMDQCFHVFDMPRCIDVRGELAFKAIIEMFTAEKIVANLGTFQVCKQV